MVDREPLCLFHYIEGSAGLEKKRSAGATELMTGGCSEDPGDGRRFVETFLSDSWADHPRQHERHRVSQSATNQDLLGRAASQRERKPRRNDDDLEHDSRETCRKPSQSVPISAPVSTKIIDYTNSTMRSD